MEFKEKTVVITGGASGIGKAAARKFASKGAQVVIMDWNMKAAVETAEIITASGGSSMALGADVSDEEQVKQAFAKIIEQYSRIDVLVNNCGVIMPKTIEFTSADEWDRIFRINTRSVFLCSKYALGELKKTKGKIINLASMNGLIGQKGNSAYAASKGAVIALSKAMAIDYAPYGIRINCICPAGVHTPLLDQWFSSMEDPEKGKRDQELAHLLGYIATPEEIAGTIVFLGSDESGFITGQAIQVEGGASLGYGSGPKAEWHSTNL
jgi:NAD(P)-dependent dehydrogenase (short-subunit alcohol dehydrogenase family)